GMSRDFGRENLRSEKATFPGIKACVTSTTRTGSRTRMTKRNKREVKRWNKCEWCDFCQREVTHHCYEDGRVEVHTCGNCGVGKSYTVK
ncbi:MAG: hypothetical protein Q8P12_04855, partial [bacterium]|nr:hypothetical protein [bacterium]